MQLAGAVIYLSLNTLTTDHSVFLLSPGVTTVVSGTAITESGLYVDDCTQLQTLMQIYSYP